MAYDQTTADALAETDQLRTRAQAAEAALTDARTELAQLRPDAKTYHRLLNELTNALGQNQEHEGSLEAVWQLARERRNANARYQLLRHAILTEATSPTYWQRRITELETVPLPKAAAPSCSYRASGPSSVAAGRSEPAAGAGVGAAASGPEIGSGAEAAELDRAELAAVRRQLTATEQVRDEIARTATAAQQALMQRKAELNAARSDLASVTRGRDALRQQADRLRRLARERRRELEVVGARAGWASLLAFQLRALVQAVEQAIGGYEPLSADWRTVQTAARQGRVLLAELGVDAQPPAGTTLTVPDSPKMLRETLCAAQTAIGARTTDLDRRDTDIARLGRLIAECDRHRPIGPDGRHGDRHTATCGCDDRQPRTGGVVTGRPLPAEVRQLRTLDEVQAQTLYAGLPNLPTEQAEPAADQVAHWGEHNDHDQEADQ